VFTNRAKSDESAFVSFFRAVAIFGYADFKFDLKESNKNEFTYVVNRHLE